MITASRPSAAGALDAPKLSTHLGWPVRFCCNSLEERGCRVRAEGNLCRKSSKCVHDGESELIYVILLAPRHAFAVPDFVPTPCIEAFSMVDSEQISACSK